MSMVIHKGFVEDDVHTDIARTYANNTARDADTAFNTVTTNFNKNVRVDSPLSIYKLMSSGTFLELSNTGGGSGNVTTSVTLTNNFLVRGNDTIDIDIANPSGSAGLFTNNAGTELFARPIEDGVAGFFLENNSGTLQAFLQYDDDAETVKIQSIKPFIIETLMGQQFTIASPASKFLINKTAGSASNPVLSIKNTVALTEFDIFLGINTPRGAISGIPGDIFYREAGLDSAIYSNIGPGVASNNDAWTQLETSFRASESPYGGFGQIENLLTFSEEFDNAIWVKDLVTVNANNALAPNGTMTADLVNFNSAVGSDITQDIDELITSTTYTVSLWGQHVSGGNQIRFAMLANQKTITFDSTMRKYSFQMTTTVTGTFELQLAAFSISGFNLWGIQVAQGVPDLGREHFPYVNTAEKQVFLNKGPGLSINDPIYMGSNTVFIHPQSGSTTAEIKFVPPVGTKNTRLVLQTDSAVDLLILESDHIGPSNFAKISTSLISDSLTIESGSITISAINNTGAVKFFNTGTSSLFRFTRNAGIDQNQLMTFVQGGTNPADVNFFFGNRNPLSNVSGAPGDYYFRDDLASSTLYVHRGTVVDNTSWIDLGAGGGSSGNVSAAADLNNNFLIKGDDNKDVDITGDGTHGLFTDDNAQILTIRSDNTVTSAGYKIFDISGAEKFTVEYNHSANLVGILADGSFGIESLGSSSKVVIANRANVPQNPMLELVRIGLNSAVVGMFMQPSTARGLISGGPGSLSYGVEGRDSAIYFNIGPGTALNSDSWTKVETSYTVSDNPFGGFGQIENLINHSEIIINAAWVKTSTVVTPNDALAPNGEMSADRVVMAGNITQAVPGLASSTLYTVSFWVQLVIGPAELTINLKGGIKVLAFDTTMRKYSFQVTTTIPATAEIIISASGGANTFNLWGVQVSEGIPTLGREHFPYIKTVATPVTPKVPGLAINDDIIFNSLIRLQSPNGIDAVLAIRPPSGIDSAKHIIQDDSGVDIFEISSDTQNNNRISLKTFSDNDFIIIESGSLFINSVNEMSFECQGTDLFSFKRSFGNDTDAVMGIEQTGTNPGALQLHIGNRSPKGNLTGDPGDVYFRDDGYDSGFYTNIGINLNSDSWTKVETSHTASDNPFGGFGQIENLLRFSENIAGSAWFSGNVTITANNALAPNGEFTADRAAWVTIAGSLIQSSIDNVDSGAVYSISLWGQHITGNDTLNFVLKGSAPHSLTFDTTMRKYTFQVTTTGDPSQIIISLDTTIGSFNLWGLQVIKGVPTQGREHFPYPKTENTPVFPMVPGLAINDDIVFSSLIRLQAPNDVSAELAIRPPAGIEETLFTIEDDGGTKIFSIATDTTGATKIVTIGTVSLTDATTIETGVLSLIAAAGSISNDIVGTNAFKFKRSSPGSTDTSPMVQYDQNGANSAKVDLFFGDRDPINNVSGFPGNLYFREDGSDSTLYVHKGSVQDTTSWFDLAIVGSGNVTTSDTLVDNFLMRGNGGVDIDLIGDGTDGIFTNADANELTVRASSGFNASFHLQESTGFNSLIIESAGNNAIIHAPILGGNLALIGYFMSLTTIEGPIRFATNSSTQGFIFTRPNSAGEGDQSQMISIQQEGNNPGDILFFAGNRNPFGNISAKGGDVYFSSNGASSSMYVKKGGGLSTTNWFNVETVPDKVEFAVDSNTGALGQARIYGCTNTSLTIRTLEISNSTIAIGTPTRPYRFTVKDSSENAGTGGLGISIFPESGTIDGQDFVTINRDGGSLSFYVDGTNVFVEKAYTPPGSDIVLRDLYSISNVTVNPNSLFFGDNGLKMYVVDFTQDLLYQYTLTTPYNIKTAPVSPDGSYGFSGTQVNGTTIDFSSDGAKFFLGSTTLSGGFNVHQYGLSTPWDITGTVTPAGALFGLDTSSQAVAIGSIKFTPDGTTLFMVAASVGLVFEYAVSPAFTLNPEPIVKGASFDISSEEGTPQSINFSADGLKMFIVGDSKDTVFQYTLNAPNTIQSGASYDGLFFKPAVIPIARSIEWKPDGTKMWLLNAVNNQEAVGEYDVYPPFSLLGGTI